MSERSARLNRRGVRVYIDAELNRWVIQEANRRREQYATGRLRTEGTAQRGPLGSYSEVVRDALIAYRAILDPVAR